MYPFGIDRIDVPKTSPDDNNMRVNNIYDDAYCLPEKAGQALNGFVRNGV